ncbi:GNAT family N-acetyltransferase [Acidipropionibacterium timonense]|uniref:GNAT family N-acetyltransferase n=1 Tax=Acidipropionibacterium timonense TaxID=2161818 RepID=UPI00102FF706|nr:GNAT family N-acetyltransferase [Acidipropionibacterium timonense]
MDTASSAAGQGPGRYVVRRATDADIPDAASVQAACLREIGHGVIPEDVLADLTGPDTVASTIDQWRGLADAGADLWVLAQQSDGKVVGVAMAQRSQGTDAPTPLELATIHVLPGARTEGAADHLLRSAIDDEPAFLWVISGNDRAVKFFENNGFRLDESEGSRDDSLGGIPLQRMVRGI